MNARCISDYQPGDEFNPGSPSYSGHKIDETIQYAIDELCGECGRAERSMQSGDNVAGRDIAIAAARALIATLEEQ